jgi:organic hydroperoxide reductase OsmC/OhrA
VFELLEGDDGWALERKVAVAARAKEFRFPVELELTGDRLTRVSAVGGPELEVAVPPEFGGPGGYWSPEDLLAASAATCFAVTFARVAREQDVPLHELEVAGTAHFGPDTDGRLALVEIELDARIVTDCGLTERAEELARSTVQTCLIARSLGGAVRLVPHLSARKTAA